MDSFGINGTVRGIMITESPQRFFPNIEQCNPFTEQARNLEVPFTEEEIHKAIQDLGNNKSPGPDGFSAEFFKKN